MLESLDSGFRVLSRQLGAPEARSLSNTTATFSRTEAPLLAKGVAPAKKLEGRTNADLNRREHWCRPEVSFWKGAQDFASHPPRAVELPLACASNRLAIYANRRVKKRPISLNHHHHRYQRRVYGKRNNCS